MSRPGWKTELDVAIAAAKQAGEAIRDLYERSAAATYEKSDGSPVTDADLAADRIIRDVIGARFPDDALLTEEGVDDTARLAADRLWVVDPIDGTAQFIQRTGEFDVLVALVVGGRPVAGVALQPSTGRYFAAASGLGALHGTASSVAPFAFEPVSEYQTPRLLSSVWLNAADGAPVLERVASKLGAAMPPVSKLGIVLRQFVAPTGDYHALIAPPKSRDHRMAWEWDYAAADIIVHEAGGRFTDAYGQLLKYNKPMPRNESGLILAVDPNTHARIVDAIAPDLPV